MRKRLMTSREQELSQAILAAVLEMLARISPLIAEIRALRALASAPTKRGR